MHRAIGRIVSRTRLKKTVDIKPSPKWWAYYKDKLELTGEIATSKLYPAGFCWQGGAVISESAMGFTTSSPAFFAMTGIGDAFGVGLGHLAFNAIKGTLGWKIDMRSELQTSIFLGTATFFSGCCWQPAVDFFHHTLSFPFFGCFFGTGIVCGTAFFCGLRFGRRIYSGSFSAVESATATNRTRDIGLSLGIAGASAFFVGTDPSFGSDNPFSSILGITQDATPVQGMMRAGSSTALGFFSSHALGYLALALRSSILKVNE